MIMFQNLDQLKWWDLGGRHLLWSVFHYSGIWLVVAMVGGKVQSRKTSYTKYKNSVFHAIF